MEETYEEIDFEELDTDTSKKSRPDDFMGIVMDLFGNINYKLTIFGPVGLKESINHLSKAYDFYKYKNWDRFEIIELKEGEKIKIKNFEILPFSVSHAVNEDDFNALSYRIEDGGRIFCYSGDSPDCNGLRESCNNSDLAIVEAALPKRMNSKSHMNGEDLGKIASEEKIKKLVVTHIYPMYFGEVESDIRKNYAGEIILAEDLMRIQL